MRALATASAILLVTLAAPPAHACSCLAIDAATAYQQADAVFEGRVLSLEVPDDPSGRLRVAMEVVQHWKGIERERVIVETAASSAACGVAFATDTSWLVYAERAGDVLRAGLCSRTQRIEEAGEDLAELGAGVVPVEVGPEDEVEEPAPAAPARGGCASCSVARREVDPRAMMIALVVLGLALARRARRRPSRQ